MFVAIVHGIRNALGDIVEEFGQVYVVLGDLVYVISLHATPINR